ncbi:MAG: hypothetical protein EB048_07290 [Gammaproteobacteria bacterium]|jgi:hypothetical protein|nr:hypothetical protein [Gammaproteobacteria bacterium]
MNKNEINGADAITPPRLRTSELTANSAFIPALILAAAHESASISELVMVYRQSGLGGERSCRKLIHRLERLNLLQIDSGSRDDRREKSVCLTAQSRAVLMSVHDHLGALGFSTQGSSTE